jgi:hypothetical protein
LKQGGQRDEAAARGWDVLDPHHVAQVDPLGGLAGSMQDGEVSSLGARGLEDRMGVPRT